MVKWIASFRIGTKRRLDMNLSCSKTCFECFLFFYLSNKLNNLNKDVEGCVPGHHAARALWEKCCYNTEETTVKEKR